MNYKEIRESFKLSQSELAKLFHTSRQMINMIESGKGKSKKLEQLYTRENIMNLLLEELNNLYYNEV